MPDLTGKLIRWSEGAPAVSPATVDLILRRLAALHRLTWWPAEVDPPWCPLDRRLTLLTRPTAERYRSEGLAVGDRFIEGWDAFDRQATPAARRLIADLSADVAPLVAALERLPRVGLHGDVKLANVALLPIADIALIDWQMTLRAPVAVELGWLLVSNVAQLPEPPEVVLDVYREASEFNIDPDDDGADWTRLVDAVGDWEAQVDLTWIVGLLLRGWRKGLDAESGTPTGWGMSGADDLAWWCDRAVPAAERRL
jgi:hypothetical protein